MSSFKPDHVLSICVSLEHAFWCGRSRDKNCWMILPLTSCHCNQLRIPCLLHPLIDLLICQVNLFAVTVMLLMNWGFLFLLFLFDHVYLVLLLFNVWLLSELVRLSIVLDICLNRLWFLINKLCLHFSRLWFHIHRLWLHINGLRFLFNRLCLQFNLWLRLSDNLVLFFIFLMGWSFLYLLDIIRVIRWLWDRVLGGAVPFNISCWLLFVLIRTVDWDFLNDHLVFGGHLSRPHSYFSSLNLWLESFVRHNDWLLLFFTLFIVLALRNGVHLIWNRLRLAPAAHWPDFELDATPLVSFAFLVLVSDFADWLPRVFFATRLNH